MQNIDLTGAQFNYVNLSRLNLHRCELGSAQFWYCNFREAKITSSHLEYSRFFDCDLRGFNSSRCDISSVNFTRVNLQGAKLGGFGEDPSLVTTGTLFAMTEFLFLVSLPICIALPAAILTGKYEIIRIS
ncbi:pentapeptide repeat-containing protein [Microcoleus sp. CAWBG24]|uniref:pentapeptide repeat-containing protein n=1 Tax=Microcoleus sp. CAWBG24 TaxID=2841644 RepID=UPI00345D8EEE